MDMRRRFRFSRNQVREQLLKITFTGLSLGMAWFLWQSQGQAIYETLGSVSRFFNNREVRIEDLRNARIVELQGKLDDVQKQNQQLKDQLNFTKSHKPKGIVAQIASRSASNWSQEITINRGQKDGIKLNDMVTAIGGLVGRVTVVNPTTSRVQLITDPSIKVGVVVTRKRHQGFIRGKWPNRAVMEFFDNLPDVKPGDFISTSAFSELFPAGWIVGRVESVNMEKSPAPEAMILLSAPMNSLEWVIVYPNNKSSDQVDLPIDKKTNNKTEEKKKK